MGKEKATDQRKWTEENMKKAIEDVISKKMGVNEASRTSFYQLKYHSTNYFLIGGPTRL